MRFVPVKDVDQQARLAWHGSRPPGRVREGYKIEGLALDNRLRGLLAEFGLMTATGERALRCLLADLDTQALPAELQELIDEVSAHWAQVRERLDTCVHALPRTRTRAACAFAPSSV